MTNWTPQTTECFDGRLPSATEQVFNVISGQKAKGFIHVASITDSTDMPITGAIAICAKQLNKKRV
jgi:hypothetical protein